VLALFTLNIVQLPGGAILATPFRFAPGPLILPLCSPPQRRIVMRRTVGLAGSWAFALAMLVGSAAIAATNQSTARQRNERKVQENLTKEVRHQLLLLPYYSVFDNLLFKVEGDKVTLLGQVVRPTLKSDAENAVKGIEGVASVNNQIEVLPNSPNDDGLRRAVYRAIYGDNVLSRYGMSALPSIHIVVKMGNVTLEGVVDSESDKNLANLRANGVPDVFSVTNNLTITSSDKK
jgi:hyperosmotically inducible periplasmic protein